MEECLVQGSGKEVVQFITGGKSYFSMKSKATQKTFSYKVKKANNNELYFVYVNTDYEKYTYAGTVYQCNDNWYYRQGEKGNIGIGAQSIQAIMWVLNNSDRLLENVEVYHKGKCAKCGRALTDVESIKRGFGPDCYAKINGTNIKTVKSSSKHDIIGGLAV